MYFPDGSPAADYTTAVRSRASNQLTLLFTDDTGETPADNPITTDEFGTGSFWAAPGDYVSVIAGTVFEYQIEPSFTGPVWPGLWVHTQSVPSVVWTIAHQFGVPPSVEVVFLGQETEADVTHQSVTGTTITFGAPVTGTAYLRR